MRNLIRAAVIAAGGVMPGLALGAGDPAAGLALAQHWCSSCHAITANDVKTDAAPSFSAVAARRDVTAGGLRAWLTDPHPPMPNLSLSRQQIDDLVSYIETMKPR